MTDKKIFIHLEKEGDHVTFDAGGNEEEIVNLFLDVMEANEQLVGLMFHVMMHYSEGQSGLVEDDEDIEEEHIAN